MTATAFAAVFVCFGLASWLVFRFARPVVAVVATVLGGWVVLPVGPYPAGAAMAAFPYWIIGSALPSDMLLTKAWVAPAVALLGALAFDARRITAWRPTWTDAPIALWCAWPVLASALVDDPRPAGSIAALYLAATWGVPWLLGRVYLASPEGRLVFLRGFVASGLACLPFSVCEGVFGPTLYGAVYEAHPFRLDGDVRYVGYRPIGFFEHGNQFAIWIALAALAALWLAFASRGANDVRRARPHAIVAALLAAMTLASQSVGAIVLLAAGAAFLVGSRHVRPRAVVLALGVAAAFVAVVYLSGAVPIARIAKETAFGRHVVDAVRATGRGSFTWRIAQDQKLLPEALARPATGHAQWDWWRASETRPWGLALLIVGQYGLIGAALSFGALLWPACRAASSSPRDSPWRAAASPLVLATIVALALLDSLLNAFVFLPAVMIAGSLAARHDPPP